MKHFLCAILVLALSSGGFTAGESFSRAQIMVKEGLGELIGEAPVEVQLAVYAANRIAGKPYKYSGGHGVWEDEGYDCSGATSYVLHAAGLLKDARSSSGFLEYGEPGPGKWITLYVRAGHVFLVIGGARFDTTDHENIGPGWREKERLEGFVARHPKGF